MDWLVTVASVGPGDGAALKAPKSHTREGEGARPYPRKTHRGIVAKRITCTQRRFVENSPTRNIYTASGSHPGLDRESFPGAISRVSGVFSADYDYFSEVPTFGTAVAVENGGQQVRLDGLL